MLLSHDAEPLQAYLFCPTIYNVSPPQPGIQIDGYHAAASPEGQALRRGLETLIRECDDHFSSSRPEWFAPEDGLRLRLLWAETSLRLGPDEEKKAALHSLWSRCAGEVRGEECEGSGETMKMCGRVSSSFPLLSPRAFRSSTHQLIETPYLLSAYE